MRIFGFNITRRRAPFSIRGRYDLDFKDLENHWRVDPRSVDASLSPDVRKRLRERARYEIANNSYAMGAGLGLANAVVGAGPRLQALSDDKELNGRVEWAFTEWQEEIRLAEKLRAMRFARYQDGESFAILHSNDKLADVKLDITPIDCDRVQAECFDGNPRDVDGVVLDEQGNPVSYRVLDAHPGDLYADTKATVFPASNVIHWFRRTTAEQHRGAPEIAASLNLFALLRRYTLAVVAAAETAADVAAYLTTADVDPSQKGEPGEGFEIQRNMIVTLPDGYDIKQLRAEQPTNTYKEFKREILGEIGRSLQIPVNVMTGDSSGYNYASGRLDHQEYQKAIRIEQQNASVVVMTPIFRQWYREYALAHNEKPELFPVQWYWDGFEHVDPVKEANAQAIRLASGATNLQIEFGKSGRDWEDALEQLYHERAVSRELAKRYGVPDIYQPKTYRQIIKTKGADNGNNGS